MQAIRKKDGKVIGLILKTRAGFKKDEQKRFCFLVTQYRMHPTLECTAGLGKASWNGIELTAGKVKKEYRVALLRPDHTLKEFDDNRNDYAGFDGKPSGVVVLGKNRGELVANYEPQSYLSEPRWNADYGLNNLTPKQAEALRTAFNDRIKSFIAENEQELHEIATELTAHHMRLQLMQLELSLQSIKKRTNRFLEELKADEGGELMEYLSRTGSFGCEYTSRTGPFGC